MKKLVLWIVDDDDLFARSCSEYLKDGPYRIERMSEGRKVIRRLADGHRPDLVLLDYKLPDMNGIEVCREIFSSVPSAKVVFITAYGSYDRALDAMDLGAFAYVIKPVDLTHLERVLKRAALFLDEPRARALIEGKGCRACSGDFELIGESAELARVKATIELSADSRAPVLVTGETGTGKSLVARLLHIRSSRKGRLVSLNCASLPENLVESELFGHVRGAFTGAASDKVGLLEIADGGTLLLDEVTEMPLHVQAKLLTALDEGVIRRVGDVHPRAVDVRIVSATNVAFADMTDQARLRRDLFYRLSVIHVHLPPLRERVEDIAPIVKHLLRTLPGGQSRRLARGELELLKRLDWPGNVRELKNLLHRTLVLTPHGDLRPSEHVMQWKQSGKKDVSESDLGGEIQALDAFVQSYAWRVFLATGRNYSRSARLLKISVGRLRRILAGTRASRTGTPRKDHGHQSSKTSS